MRKPALFVATLILIAASAWAHGDIQLPAGPIHDRHDLMERVGKQAKIIGDALKAGTIAPVGPAAEVIQTEIGKALPLFPKGSTHPNSRAKAEIWEKWADFEASMKKLESDAGALATTVKNAGDVRGAAQTMFGNCKSCHDSFRVPEKD